MIFHWSLSDSNFTQISRTLLSILANLNNAVVWTVSTRPLIFTSYSHCTYLWWLYSMRPLHLVSPSFSCSVVFQISGKDKVFISLFAFLQFYPVVSRNGKTHYSAGSLFCLILLGLVVWSRLDDLLVVAVFVDDIIIIIIIHSLKLFTSALAHGFSLESEWQQVSSSLQDSSQYSGRFQ